MKVKELIRQLKNWRKEHRRIITRVDLLKWDGPHPTDKSPENYRAHLAAKLGATSEQK